MATFNINRNVTDAFYRYKMPPLITKVEGKGNGIKTVIVNASDVAKSLSRPPSHVTKFFGFELGAQTKCDSKTDKYVVNGVHEQIKLQTLLDDFIRKFILCQECCNPETTISTNSKKMSIDMTCKACGKTSSIDSKHKLCSVIIKDVNFSHTKSSTGSGKENKKVLKKQDNKVKDGEHGSAITNSEYLGFGLSGLGSVFKNFEKNESGSEHVITSAPQDKNWNSDWSDDADQGDEHPHLLIQSNDDFASASANAIKNPDVSQISHRKKTALQKHRVDSFYHFVNNVMSNGDANLATQTKEIAEKAKSLHVETQAPLILAEIMYDKNILTQIPKYRNLMLTFTLNNHKAQFFLLDAFELLVMCGDASLKKQLLAKAAHILKVFYDHDILDEDVILKWNEQESSKNVSIDDWKELRDKVMPFVTALREAEEDDEEDEDDRKCIAPDAKFVQRVDAVKQNEKNTQNEAIGVLAADLKEFCFDENSENKFERGFKPKYAYDKAGPNHHSKCESDDDEDDDIDIDAI